MKPDSDEDSEEGPYESEDDEWSQWAVINIYEQSVINNYLFSHNKFESKVMCDTDIFFKFKYRL